MPLSEGAASVGVSARAYRYDVGPAGPARERAVAVEAAVQFAFGGVPFAVMMVTPRDLVDFAYGFALTEGIVRRPAEIREVAVEPVEDGWRANVALSADLLRAHLARGRALAGRTGCGLCGVEDFSQLPAPPRRHDDVPPASPAAIGAALRALDAQQGLNRETRAAHGAAWCDADGRILALREDVGRHNALDKAIGALARADAAAGDGFFVVTSRCSFEMAAKAAMFGARTLVSLSAPTSLALARARDWGLTIIAVARADEALCFEDARASSSGGLAA